MNKSEKGTNKIKVHRKLHPIMLSQLRNIEATSSINIFTGWMEQTIYFIDIQQYINPGVETPYKEL